MSPETVVATERNTGATHTLDTALAWRNGAVCGTTTPRQDAAGTHYMTTLTRQMLIDQLHAVETGTQPATNLATWAFDQFYAEEAGEIEYEAGFRRIIGHTLDDLMFGDAPGFTLSANEARRMIEELERAEPAPDDEDDEDEDDLTSS